MFKFLTSNTFYLKFKHDLQKNTQQWNWHKRTLAQLNMIMKSIQMYEYYDPSFNLQILNQDIKLLNSPKFNKNN